ncbi:MAG: hypothetical protein IMF19_14230 [Proteobacteria bacterium]|nr:hypothetical protein [Pseudomonadota bacterium]
MIADDTIQILWKHKGFQPNYKFVSLKTALAMRKELLVSDYEVKIRIMKEKKWVTVSETKGWET